MQKIPKSLSSYVKCKNCKKTDVKFSSEENETSYPYLKKWHAKNVGITGFVAHYTR